MNELIKELAEQADIFFYQSRVPETGFEYEAAEVTVDDLKKFAELIVRECISIGQETSREIFQMSKKEGDIFEYWSHGAEDVVDNIKEHFGVEE